LAATATPRPAKPLNRREVGRLGVSIATAAPARRTRDPHTPAPGSSIHAGVRAHAPHALGATVVPQVTEPMNSWY
jgi:hypothetical protein